MRPNQHSTSFQLGVHSAIYASIRCARRVLAVYRIPCSQCWPELAALCPAWIHAPAGSCSGSLLQMLDAAAHA